MVESDHLDRYAVQEHVGRYTGLRGGLGWRRLQFGFPRWLLIVDGKVHLAGVADRRDQFVVEPCRSRPYKEVGGSSVLEGLDEDLVLAAFYLECLRRTYCNRGHRFSDLNDGQVVQRRLNPDDPVACWRFRVNLLAWQREGNCQKTHEDASHFAWTPFQKAARGGARFRGTPQAIGYCTCALGNGRASHGRTGALSINACRLAGVLSWWMLAGSPSTNTAKLSPYRSTHRAMNRCRSSALRSVGRVRIVGRCRRFENVTVPFRISPDPS